MQYGGHSLKMAAVGGRGSCKMAVIAYFQSHSKDLCVMVAAASKAIFLQNTPGNTEFNWLINWVQIPDSRTPAVRNGY